MRLTVLTRASDLARLQGLIVQRRIEQQAPGASVTLAARESAGDRDAATPLAKLADKGAFTEDLSAALARGDADIVVHSWKDLPVEDRGDTVIAATLPREDPRDVLLVRRDALGAHRALRILSSSPRRAWQLSESLAGLWPWPLASLECAPVRGNVPTRVRRLVEGAGDALVVAKAALDRLLDPSSPFTGAAAGIRVALEQCAWMVLPLREFPCAAAQGALAIEVCRRNTRLIGWLDHQINDARTWRAVTRERAILAAHGGGCHQAIGAAVQLLPFGEVTSVRGVIGAGATVRKWTLAPDRPAQPRTTIDRVWPRPDERGGHVRRALPVADPSDGRGLYVTRDEALPAGWRVDPQRPVWVAGASTWRKLAARGIWVHGSSEALGQFDPAVVDRLAGRAVAWHRLTHATADVPDALATYDARVDLPPDLAGRTHFFWRSASEFRQAITAFPPVRDGWHGTGPGHTLDVVERIAGASRVRPALGYAEWLEEITA